MIERGVGDSKSSDFLDEIEMNHCEEMKSVVSTVKKFLLLEYMKLFGHYS